MFLVDLLNNQGEHKFVVEGVVGSIELILTTPANPRKDYIAFLGHPHSLQGGTMNNKVVTTMSRVFKELRIPCVRFNFRGVGASAGVYDAGIGESDDMLMLVSLCLEVLPDARCIFAGFSFGSYVTYRAASLHEHALLITIAPPVSRYDYAEFVPAPNPWIVVQGDKDEVVPVEIVRDFVAEEKSSLIWMEFADTGHFFHGKLVELKARLAAAIKEQISL